MCDCDDPNCSTGELHYAARKEIERNDRGCQAKEKRRYSPDAVTMGWVCGYCPACHDARCHKTRAFLRYKPQGRDIKLGECLERCANCARQQRVYRLCRCLCCDRWFFICGDCQERTREGDLVMMGPSWYHMLAPVWFDRLWRRLTGGRRG